MLKQRALSATLWSGADAFLRQGIQFCVSVVLARLVSPEEFGTIALLSLFTGLTSLFVQSGFSNALIQRQSVSRTDESTVFWFQCGMGALMATALWAAGPWIAAFFAKPILVPLAAVMGVNIFISSLGSIQTTLLTKHLDFRILMKIGAIATVVSGSIGIAMAWQHYGVWALAAQTVASTTSSTVLLWLFTDWRPQFIFSVASLRKLFGFGGFLLIAAVLDVGYNRIYTILIGKMYGVRELGFYNRADGTKHLPTDLLSDILARAAFPIFSAAADEPERLRRGVRLSLRGIMFINIPMMLGLAVVADSLIVTVFGSTWLPAAPIMKVLCLGGVLWPLQIINLNVLLAQGHSQLFFRLEIIKKVLGVGFLLVGAMFGVMGMAWSQVALSVAAFGVNAHYTKRFLGYGIAAQVWDILPMLGIAALMWGTLHWMGLVLHMASVLKLAVLIVAGASSYFLLALALRLAIVQDVLALFRDRGLLQSQSGSSV